VGELREALAGNDVVGARIGRAGGDLLVIRVGDGVVEERVGELAHAWRVPFGG
jgi:hypothetical protein